MARVARRDALRAVHHVLLRGIERRRIFLVTLDREDFLERLAHRSRSGDAAQEDSVHRAALGSQ
jgi:hypothetical protein